MKTDLVTLTYHAKGRKPVTFSSCAPQPGLAALDCLVKMAIFQARHPQHEMEPGVWRRVERRRRK